MINYKKAALTGNPAAAHSMRNNTNKSKESSQPYKQLDIRAIADAASLCADWLVPRWFPCGKREGREWVCLNPHRPDNSLGSLKINLDTCLWADFASGEKGRDLVSLLAFHNKYSQSEAAKELAQELGLNAEKGNNKLFEIKPKKKMDDWQPIVPIPADAPPPPDKHYKHGKPNMRWLYHNNTGQQILWVYRFDKDNPENKDKPKKDFLPLTFCKNKNGETAWRFQNVAAPRPLYNLHLISQYPDATVIICEGEKSADAVAKLLPIPTYVTTTSPNGAKSADKADWLSITGRQNIFWPDNDEEGQTYVIQATTIIKAANTASKVVILPLADFGKIKEGWDAADALAEGWTSTQIQDLVAAALAKPEPIYEETFPANKAGNNSPYRLHINEKGKRDGVYFYGQDKDGDPLKPLWICSPLEITARTHDGKGHNWGSLLKWTDLDGQPHQWPMPSEMLAGQGDEYRRELLNRGLQIAPGGATKNHLTHYIQSAHTEARVRCTDKTGWHDNVFVLPSGCIGNGQEQVLYQTSALHQHAFRQRGTLEKWQKHISLPLIGNSRAIFAVSCAFAPLLLNMLGEESGGFHFRGGTSSGKTTLLKLACSVMGSPDYLQRWRATTNGLEGIAQLYNHCLLVLDELAQVDPKDVGEIAYMLGNGQGRVRAGRDGMAKKTARWQLLYLSAGEISLADHLNAGGKQVKAGQEVRLADIPADTGRNMGVFEQLNDCDNSALFSRQLCDASTKYYGKAGIAFLEHLIIDLPLLSTVINKLRQQFMDAAMPKDAAGQVERVAARFALVAAAGELASHYSITGWDKGEAEWAAKQCFLAWLEARGGAGELESTKLLADIRAQLEAHGESRFSVIGNDTIRVNNRMGFIREANGEKQYIVMPESFKRELCKGHDPSRAAKVLHELGILLPDNGDRKLQRRESLPGLKRMRCYVLQANKLWETE